MAGSSMTMYKNNTEFTNIKLVLSTQGRGKEVYVMDKEQYCGMTELDTKENGRTIKLAEMVSSSILMETCMTGSGPIINLMAMVSTRIQKELATRVIGRMISSMDKVLRHGLEMLNMTVNITWESNKAWAPTLGLINLFMKVSGSTTSAMDSGNINGATADSITASGLRMTWKESVFISTLMAYATMDNIRETRKMATAFTFGQTVVNMKAGGPKANSTG